MNVQYESWGDFDIDGWLIWRVSSLLVVPFTLRSKGENAGRM